MTNPMLGQEAIIRLLADDGFYIVPDKVESGLYISGILEGDNVRCGFISQLKDVVALRLIGSDIADDGFAELCNMKDLHRLRLVAMQLTAEGFQAIERLQMLHDLDARISFPGDLAAESIARLSKLRRLSLLNCGLTSNGLRRLGACRELEELRISGNPLSEGFDALEKCAMLRLLDVSDCPLILDGARQIAQLKSLEQLIVDHSPIDDEMMSEIARMRQLRKLFVFLSQITAQSLSSIAALVNLEELSWPSSALDPKRLDVFTRLPKLRELTFYWEPAIDERVLQQLQKRLPQCHVSQWGDGG